MPYIVLWDNGHNASGSFKGTFDTEEEAQEWADDITRENRYCGVWDRKGFCEVKEVDEVED